MKIIQLNAWVSHLMNPFLSYLATEQPTILCTQEILSTPSDKPIFADYALHEKLSELFPYSYYVPTWGFKIMGGKTLLGNGIYSQYPLTDFRSAFSNGHFVEEQTLQNYTPNLRVVQSATVTGPNNQRFSIVNHHGFHDINPMGNEQTVVAMKKVADFIRSLEGPLVVCGDLNIKPESPALAALDTLGLTNLTVQYKLKTTLTSVSGVPEKDSIPCDYIFTRDMTVRDFYADEVVVSDHKPLVVEVDVTLPQS